jgi:hypothetical protein
LSRVLRLLPNFSKSFWAIAIKTSNPLRNIRKKEINKLELIIDFCFEENNKHLETTQVLINAFSLFY